VDFTVLSWPACQNQIDPPAVRSGVSQAGGAYDVPVALPEPVHGTVLAVSGIHDGSA
jgi:hypothetical protein